MLVSTLPDQELWMRAQRAATTGDTSAAISDLRSLLQRHPSLERARILLAAVFLAQGRVQLAATELLAARSCLPDDVDAVRRLVQALMAVGETNAAVNCLNHTAIAQCRSAPLLLAIAHLYQGLGLHSQALALMDRAMAFGLDNGDFIYFRALQLQFNGRLEEAERDMERAIWKRTSHGRAQLSLSRIRRQTSASNHVKRIREQIHRVERGTEHHACLNFALHKELDDLGETSSAWGALVQANEIMRDRLPYNAASEKELVTTLQRCFPCAVSYNGVMHARGPIPIFIVGMPRSGTTLLERILSRHPMIASAGELADFPKQLRWTINQHGHALLDKAMLSATSSIDYRLLGERYLLQTQWRADGRQFYIDKLPPNYMLIGYIRRALPHARILHLTRDPIGLCFSNFRAMFGDAYAYSYDLARLAHHHRLYTKIMQHWRKTDPGSIHDVSYADLVTDTEATVRAVLASCSIPFDPRCLEHSNGDGSIATLSSAQVRQPIHSRSIGEWQRYANYLQPLTILLNEDRM